MVKLNSKPKKRILTSKKLLKLAYKICKGNATKFDLKAITDEFNSEAHYKVWKSKCNYLALAEGKTGIFECELLKERSFEKLSDPTQARCTLALLVQLCDFYLERYDRTGILFEGPDKVKDRTPTIVPDYEGVLRRCKLTNWIHGNQPKKWYYFLCRCAYNEAYNSARRTIRCGVCLHFLPKKMFCVAQEREAKSQDKICADMYDPIPMEGSLMASASTSDVRDKIRERMLQLFVLELKSNPGKQKHEIHLTVAEKLLTGDYQREKIAKSFGKSLKTIDRSKLEVQQLMKEFAQNDPELLVLWENHVELDNRPPDYGHQLVSSDEELDDIKP